MLESFNPMDSAPFCTAQRQVSAFGLSEGVLYRLQDHEEQLDLLRQWDS